MEISDWFGCYAQRWPTDMLDPASGEHPARFAKVLCERIFSHGNSRGYWDRESLIGDPFAGVGLGGIVAAHQDLLWFGVEIEPTFVEIAWRNFLKQSCATSTRWNECFPAIANGDSRLFSSFAPRVNAIVSSPPFEDCLSASAGVRSKQRAAVAASLGKRIEDVTPTDMKGGAAQAEYGSTEGQVGLLRGAKYREAMTQIYGECHKSLVSGGVMALVLKNYVAKGKLVDLVGWTIECLESLGFEVFELTRSWLVTETRYASLFEDRPTIVKRGRKSWYRRLYEQKHPENAIDWEGVIWARKPSDARAGMDSRP